MKKIMTLALAAVMALSLVACSSNEDSSESKNALDKVVESGKITVAVSPDFAPSEFKDPATGEVLGSDIYVAQYIADYLGNKYDKEIKLEILEMDFKSCQAAVYTDSVDFSLNGYAATDDRRENYYCSTHYGKTTGDSYQGLLVMADQASEFNSAESFAGKKIAAQLSSLQYNLIVAQLPDIEVEYVTTITNGALLLTTGKVDALATTSDTGSLLMKNYDGLAMAEFKLDYSSDGSCALINIDETELGQAIDEALEDMNANVNFDEIRQQYTDLAADLGVTNE